MKSASTMIIMAVLAFSFDVAAAPRSSDGTTVAAVTAANEELVVDVEPTVPNANNLSRRLEASARSALAGVESPRGAEDRVLVHVTGEQYDYELRISAIRTGLPLEEKLVRCECNTAELSERVSVEVTRIAARFSEAAVPPDGPPQQEPTQAEPAAEPTPPTMVLPEARLRKPALGPAKRAPTATLEPVTHKPEPVVAVHESRRIRVAGIVSLVAGSALLFAGAGMMAAGSTELLDQWRHYQRDWRPLGFTVGGVGLASIGIGGSLMLFEELRCRRRPDSCASRRQYAKKLEYSPTKGTNR